jgi:hypothetical protein
MMDEMKAMKERIEKKKVIAAIGEILVVNLDYYPLQMFKDLYEKLKVKAPEIPDFK